MRKGPEGPFWVVKVKVIHAGLAVCCSSVSFFDCISTVRLCLWYTWTLEHGQNSSGTVCISVNIYLFIIGSISNLLGPCPDMLLSDWNTSCDDIII